MPFAATWIEIIHEVSEAKLSKSDRERKIPYDLTYMCNLKKYKWKFICMKKYKWKFIQMNFTKQK